MNWSEQDLEKYQQRQMKYSTVRPVSETLRKAIDKANAKLAPPLEDQEQANLIQWLKLRNIRFNATPNGGYRHKATAGKLKAQGVVSGFPDITIWPGSGQPILFIELKRTKGGSVSAEQKEWLDYLDSLHTIGFPVRSAVCKGFDEARQFILSWGY
jgi:hypothetical protein